MTISDRNNQTAVWKQFSSKEIEIMSASAPVRTLNPGDVLIRAGENRDKIYIILSGKIRIAINKKNKQKNVATLGPGDWIGELHFPREIDEASFAVASENSKVLLVDKDAINRLDDKAQLAFYKHMEYLSNQRIQRFECILENIEHRNKKLMDDIFIQRSGIKTDFRRMEILRGITSKVPRLPAFANTLANRLLEDKISVNEVAEEVMKDPALVGTVLKTINSVYYGLEKKISDMRYATTFLGLDMMYQLIIAEGIKRTMPDTPAFREIHTRSVILSQLSFTLAKESEVGAPAEIATIGLLNDVGQIIIHLLKEKNPNFDMYINMLDKSQMGALLLKTWNLPDIIWQSIEYQFYPEFSVPDRIPEEVKNNVTILYLTRLCYEIFRGQSLDKLPVTFLDEYLQIVNWENDSIKGLAEKRLLPALIKKISTSPFAVKQLIKRYSQ